SRRLRPSTPKMTRAAQISGNMGTRSTSYDQRIFRDDTDNNYTHSRDCLAAARQLKYESMAEQQRMRWSMASTEMEQSDSGQQSVIKAVLLFFAAFALYFFTHSPALDEIDAVQFAMGVPSFDIWNHQPHPPGYPLFIFFGWIATKFFTTSPETSLYLVSSLGGALFVAAWFLVIRLQFKERLAWWIAACLTITPAVWMTATKVLSDSLAAGFLSAELFAALCFLLRQHWPSLLSASLLGAA